MKFSEVVNRVIDLSRKVREYYDRELPKCHPNYPLIGPDEETAPPPPEEKELRDFLVALPQDAIDQMVLLLHLGRDEVSADDLAGGYEEVKGTLGDPKLAAEYLVHLSPLADQLSDGLEELRKHKINVDKLPLKKVKVRKR